MSHQRGTSLTSYASNEETSSDRAKHDLLAGSLELRLPYLTYQKTAVIFGRELC